MSRSQRREYIGRRPQATADEPAPREVPGWVVPTLVVLLLVIGLNLTATGGLLALGLVLLPVAMVCLGEFERRRLRVASFGFVDARTAQSKIVITSSRAALWLAAAIIAASVAHVIVLVLVFSDLARASARPGGTASFLLAAVIGAGMGVSILWSAVRAASVTLDQSGVHIRATRFGRSRFLPWPEDMFARAHGGKLTVLTGRGTVTCNVRYLRTDPVIVADIINRCADDPAMRTRLGDEMIDLLKAEEPWRRNRPKRGTGLDAR